MNAARRDQVFKLRDLCLQKALAGMGDTSLDAVTSNEAKALLNSSVGPKMTYNELANKLDSIIRGFN
jgi:TnpA family transposase